MLVDLKEQIRDEHIIELISYSVHPDPERVYEVIEEYEYNPYLYLAGLELEEEIIGVIGYSIDEFDTLEINHIAIKPEYRGGGYGRGIILELIEEEAPAKIIAETDDDAVEFYRRIGFAIQSLGEERYGIERYLCTYEVNLDPDS